MDTIKQNRISESRFFFWQSKNLLSLAVGLLIALTALTISIIPFYAQARQTPECLDTPVTIQFQNKPLKEVLSLIGKQTGISIVYDQSLANEIVIGNFNKTKASDAVNRLFKDKNKVIQVDDERKVIVVKTFGAKNFIWAGPTNIDKPMTLAEFNEMQDQQHRQYKERIADENEILEGGVTQGELLSMHKAQYLAYKERISNKSEFIPEAGMTRGELSEIQKNQYDNYRGRSLNEDEIIDVDQQISRKELQSMQHEQYSSYRQRIENPGSQIAENGESLSAIHLRQKQQYDEYQTRLKNKSVIIDNL